MGMLALAISYWLVAARRLDREQIALTLSY